jgi:hypothetical protein
MRNHETLGIKTMNIQATTTEIATLVTFFEDGLMDLRDTVVGNSQTPEQIRQIANLLEAHLTLPTSIAHIWDTVGDAVRWYFANKEDADLSAALDSIVF